MQAKKLLVMIALLSLGFSSCSKNNSGSGGGTTSPPTTPPTTPPTNPPAFTPLITLPPGWKPATSYMTTFPQGIQLFQFDSIYNNQRIKAFCLAYDSRNTTFEFKPVLSATAKTPTTFFSEEQGGATYACINGGYFGGNQSYSLVKYNNTVLAPNIKALTRTFNGANTSYFPTRAAFGISSTGTPSVAWIYHVGSGNDLIYSYPSPSPNTLGLPPQPVPDANFPMGGSAWNTTSAIGGSPVLIKNNEVRVSDAEELIDINNGSSRPRSAIGYLSNGMVLLLAVEGDNAPDYPGINLANLAALLKALGCTEAINLDGGGSTSMVVSGTRTVRPSNGTERAVPSVVIIKRK